MLGKSGTDQPKMGKIDTILGSGAEVKGSVMTRGTLRIEGKVEGGIVSEDGIIISETGTVKGDLTAKFIIIGGKVDGDVYAQARVEMLPTGQLHGDIRAPRLIIAEGVIFEGNCEMVNEKLDIDLKIIKKQF